MSNMGVSTAIVLCAGRGKRLKPFTDTVPKPLLLVDGKPTLDFILQALLNAGIENIVFVAHHLGEQIQTYAEQQTFFSKDNVVCTKQEQLAGTADATIAAIRAKPEWFQSAFLLTASDYLVPRSFYVDLLDAYKKSQKSIAVSMKRIDESELAMRSSVRFNEQGDVTEVVEKPAAGTAPSALSANLVFVLPADINHAITQVQPSERGEKEIQSAVNAYLQANGAGCGLEQDTPAEWTPP